METDRESDLNESSLADMEQDSGSSYEMPKDLKKPKQESDDAEESKKASEESVESFIEDAIEIISCTSPNFRNTLS